MSKSFEKALSRLVVWYERQKRGLPWREDPSLYRVWISEIMLQQTQVASVIPFFEKFIHRFPTVSILAESSVEEVLKYWAGLGYYSRAGNLHRAAGVIAARREFPRTREEWLEIPGVGPYTAGAILSIALDQPEAILDGNVERVLSRLKKIGRQGVDADFKDRLWAFSRKFVEEGFKLNHRPSVVNQALMELGATVCTPRAPRCEACPLSQICKVAGTPDVASYPPRRKRQKWIEMQEELHCVIDGRKRILLKKRKPGEWRAGLWDFPDQPPQDIRLTRGLRLLGEVRTKHIVTRHRITRKTQVWEWSSWQASDIHLGTNDAIRWARSGAELPTGSAFKRTMVEIRAKFPEALPQN